MAQVQRYELEREAEEEPSWGWRYRDDNGEIISQGESHPSPEGVQRAVNNVAREFTQLFLTMLMSKLPPDTPLEALQAGLPSGIHIPIVDV